MKSQKEKSDLSRREFIKKTSAGMLGVSILSSIPTVVKGAVFSPILSAKSKVVLVTHSKVIAATGEVDRKILKEMLDTAILKFSGEKSPESFWKKNFSPKDIIGLKINTLGLSKISGSPATDHFNAVTSAIIESCSTAGIKEDSFIIWDRSEDELSSAGFAIQKEKGKKRILANISFRDKSAGEGYDTKDLQAGEKTTRVSKVLKEMTTAMINVPVMKTHRTAGVTGSLKNHYGTIENPREFHSNYATNPGIPEINLLDEIRNKQKLIIMDALLGVFNNGPGWDREFMWPFGGIMIGTDPVAIDTIMFGIINEKRKTEGLDPITESNARHLKISAEMGVGKNNLNEIELIKINLG